MEATYDKQRILSNSRWLEAYRNIPENDLEEKIGKSKGYLYRWSQEDNGSVPGIDFLIDVANVMDVSLQSLMEDDMTQARADDAETLQFIRELKQRTECDALIWYQEGKEKMSGWEPTEGDYEPTSDAAPKHPLCEYSEEANLDIEYTQKAFWGYEPLVLEREGEIAIVGEACFHLRIGDTLRLYIVPLMYEPTGKKEESKNVPMDYDILFLEKVEGKKVDYKKEPVLSTYMSSPALRQACASLYKVVQESQDRTHIVPEMRSVIDDYMNSRH